MNNVPYLHKRSGKVFARLLLLQKAADVHVQGSALNMNASAHGVLSHGVFLPTLIVKIHFSPLACRISQAPFPPNLTFGRNRSFGGQRGRMLLCEDHFGFPAGELLTNATDCAILLMLTCQHPAQGKTPPFRFQRNCCVFNVLSSKHRCKSRLARIEIPACDVASAGMQGHQFSFV